MQESNIVCNIQESNMQESNITESNIIESNNVYQTSNDWIRGQINIGLHTLAKSRV